ncbi:MAG TPA: cyclic-di-AMP receptor [Mobilitalea sp.]|nr:cyclic-di-AMP receptor [Mobilitalea sp.]
MKLVYVIVRNIDSGDVTQALNKQGFYVTKMASTGGFLREGNTTLMIGTDEDKVEVVIDIVKTTCGPRKQIISNPVGFGEYAASNVVVNVGGATIFVMDVDRYEKI